MANVVKTVYWDFNKSLFNAFHKELKAFYTVQSSAQLLEALPFLDLTKDDANILTSRWLFFRQLHCQIVKSQEVDEDRSDHCETFPFGFPPTTMFKSKFQIMYNSLKGGLDANTQQYISIQPPMKTKFEAKYIICMMIVIVTNSWRLYQLLSETVDIDSFTLSMFKKRLRNSGMPLQEFNYNLAIALRNRSTNPNFLNGIIQATTSEQPTTEATNSVEINYSTLRDRICNQFVPLKQRRRAFMNNRALMELRLAKNSDFQHKTQKIDGGKVKHCALCGVGQTRSECSECQIPLCVYQGVHLSCFTLWHTEKDLESSREAVLQSRTSQKNDECERVQ
jgi:hypothetical protein